MTSRWLPRGVGLLAGPVLIVVSGIAGGDGLASRLHAQQAPPRPTDDRGPRPPQGRPADPGPRNAGDRAIGPLNHAYDQITVAAVWMKANSEKLDKDDKSVLDQSKDLYRKAITAYRAGQYRRAEATALAAHDAARGVVHVLAAHTSAVEGVPVPPLEAEMGPPPPRPGREAPPPRGRETAVPPVRDRVAAPPVPAEREVPPAGAADRPRPPQPGGARRDGAGMVRNAIREIREEVQEAGQGATRGAGRQFIDAARRALDQAQKLSDDGKNRQAIQLVMAAEAWSHVPEHLKRAEGATRGTPPREPGPDGRRDPARPRDRGPATLPRSPDRDQ